MASQRVLVNTSATMRRTFTVDGDATDADGTVTYAVVNAAGTSVQTGNATSEGSGVYRFLLNKPSTVAEYTVTWSGTWSGIAQSVVDYVEVVGAHLFTETEARAYYGSDLSSTTVYTDAKIAEARDRIADEFEEICGVSFVPKFRRERLPGTGRYELYLARPKTTSLITATVTGTDVSSNVTILPDPGNVLYRTDGVWTTPPRSNPLNVTVEYQHGWSTPPADIRRAALMLLRHHLVRDTTGGGIPERALSLTDELGTIRLAQPGRFGNAYGIPAVDAALKRYSHKVFLHG